MTPSLQRVLLVEDEEPARLLIARGLSRRGYRVTVAADGAEALPMLHAGWDALVTDLRMPRLDGLELLRTAAPLRCKRIVITSFADKDRTIAALNLGAHYLLEKPFGVDRLAEVLARLLSPQAENASRGLDERLMQLPLHPRERPLVAGVLRGQSNRQIGLAVGLSEQSVKNCLTAIYARLGVQGRGGLFHALFPV